MYILGALSLFEVERDGIPKAEPYKSVVPLRNSLFIFLVSVNSFHRVEQLLSDRGRMTIGGWFHGPPLPYPDIIPEPNPYALTSLPKEIKSKPSLKDWITPIYLTEEAQNDIQIQFEEDSQIKLHEFILKDKYDSLLELVKSKKNDYYTVKSPPLHRYYLGRDCDINDTSLLGEFYRVLLCDEFIELLNKITGLELSQYFCELRRFESNHFTLMHDGDARKDITALDCMFYLIDDKEWDDDWGGYTSYNDEEGELLTVTPSSNTLALVYCDNGTSRFTKLIRHGIPMQLNNIYLLATEDV